MNLTSLRSLLGVSALAVATLVGLAGPAAASCAPPPEKSEHLKQADTVFVGTVVSVEQEGFWANVRVEEVWKGKDLPTTVQVRGGEAAGPDQARTSVDRSFQANTRYLFAPFGESAPFSDNSCSPTEEWNEGLAQHRPADWRKPDPSAGAAGDSDGKVEPTADTGGSTGAPDGGDEGEVHDVDAVSDGQGDGAGEVLGDDPTVSDEDKAAWGSPVMEGDPASSQSGLDGGLVASAIAVLLGLIALGWWLRRDVSASD